MPSFCLSREVFSEILDLHKPSAPTHWAGVECNGWATPFFCEAEDPWPRVARLRARRHTADLHEAEAQLQHRAHHLRVLVEASAEADLRAARGDERGLSGSLAARSVATVGCRTGLGKSRPHAFVRRLAPSDAAACWGSRPAWASWMVSLWASSGSSQLKTPTSASAT